MRIIWSNGKHQGFILFLTTGKEKKKNHQAVSLTLSFSTVFALIWAYKLFLEKDIFSKTIVKSSHMATGHKCGPYCQVPKLQSCNYSREWETIRILDPDQKCPFAGPL